MAVVCNSTPEAELAAAHLALRTVGLPAMDVFDLVCGRPVCLKLYEDNQAAIQVIKTGRNPTMRHLQRTHGISVRWLHDLFYPKDDMGNTEQSVYQLEYIESKLQRADIFTKAFRDPKEWLRVQSLIGIALRSRDRQGKPTGKVLNVATQAAGPAGGDAEGARTNALWCALDSGGSGTQVCNARYAVSHKSGRQGCRTRSIWILKAIDSVRHNYVRAYLGIV